jgi:hypothetical protein
VGDRSFRASQHSAYCREFAAVFGRLPPAGIAGVACYRDVCVEGRVRLVTSNYKQEDIVEPARYSVIDCLLRRADM